MKPSKPTKRILLIILLITVAYAFHYAWFAFPIISGYGAKNACSCLFLQGRTKADIQKSELGSFPLSLGSIEVNLKDSTVTGSVFGLARQKALYRNGLGCTLINDISESTIRKQAFLMPPPVPFVDTSRWITGIPDSLKGISNISPSKLELALQIAFAPLFENKAPGTRALLVVHNGNIIAEKYAPGFGADTKLLGWSMAKSVTGALVGLLVKDGLLDVSEQAPIDQWSEKGDRRGNITLEHLLQQTTGLDYKEEYSQHSHATHMLFYKGDMAQYIAGLPLQTTPGKTFYYSSGNSNLLSGIIRKTLGPKRYHAFPYAALFHKIGMYHTLLEPDASGTYVGSSYIFATARDYARFGTLYLNDGVWNGKRILPEGWVQKSVNAPAENSRKNYGYQFWLNGFDEEEPQKRVYPEAPADLFMANGYGGQRIYVIPSKKLVVVRLGLNAFDEHGFLQSVLAAVP